MPGRREAEPLSLATWFAAAVDQAAGAAALGAPAAMLALVAGCVRRARRGGRLPRLRRPPGLEALQDAVGWATEAGRPVHLTPGIGGTANPQVMAAFPVVRRLARDAAVCDTRLINSNADVLVLAVNEEIIRDAYAAAGRGGAFNPADVRFLSDSQFAYAAGVMGLLRRERPAVNVLYGDFGAEAMILLQAGAEAGAVQVGATANTYQLPFFAAACDHTLLGEELYAASAQLSGDPVLLGTVVAQDLAKIGALVLIALGLLLRLVGGPAADLARALGG